MGTQTSKELRLLCCQRLHFKAADCLVAALWHAAACGGSDASPCQLHRLTDLLNIDQQGRPGGGYQHKRMHTVAGAAPACLLFTLCCSRARSSIAALLASSIVQPEQHIVLGLQLLNLPAVLCAQLVCSHSLCKHGLCKWSHRWISQTLALCHINVLALGHQRCANTRQALVVAAVHC